MKVLELQLPEQTATNVEEVAERRSVSPEQLSILGIEEKLAENRGRIPTLGWVRAAKGTLIEFPDALLIPSEVISLHSLLLRKVEEASPHAQLGPL